MSIKATLYNGDKVYEVSGLTELNFPLKWTELKKGSKIVFENIKIDDVKLPPQEFNIRVVSMGLVMLPVSIGDDQYLAFRF